MEAGVVALVEKTATVFIYLNLLLTLVGDDQDAELLRPCDSLEKYKSFGSHGKPLTPLLPRPAYMNTCSFVWMLERLLDEHGHAVEHVLFNPLFAPRPGGAVSKWLAPVRDPAPNHRLNHEVEDRFERDVLADRQSLHEALKSMWRVLVFCDMVFCEADKAINWERVSINAMAQLFLGKTGVARLVGGDWVEYAMDRKEAGGFRFYVNGDVDVYADVSEGGDDSG